MDISFLKWPIIIVVVVGGIWLVTSGGISFMEKKATAYVPGTSAEQDIANEANLSKLGRFLLMTFRYQWAEKVYNEALRRYPEGANSWINMYRVAKCAEKRGAYAKSVENLDYLRLQDANKYDKRVPAPQVLKLRINKLLETHELGELIP